MARSSRHKRKAPPARTAELRIETLGAGGDGVAAVDGAPAYIPYTAPGDFVRAELRGDRGGVLDLLEQSPHRAEPPCAHYGECGGCALQHLDADYYRGWKRGLVVNALAREGFDENIVAPLVACPPASRRRATFAVIRQGKDVRLGFNRRRSSMIEDVASCAVLASALEKRLPALRALAAAMPYAGFDLAVTLCENGVDIDIRREGAGFLKAHEIERLAGLMRAESFVRLTLNGEPVLEFEKPLVLFGGVQVAPPPGGFLQASREGEAALVDLATAPLSAARRVADLFSGCGTFSFPLAKGAAIDAFDADRPAIDALAAAARVARLAHPARATVRNLFVSPLTVEELSVYDACVFDPPRAGAKAQAETLAASAIPIVVGVSCNPATFARDAAILRDGDYHLSQVTPVDQFVYAPHVELVGVFLKG